MEREIRVTPETAALPLRLALSRITASLALLLILATAFWISPRPGETYPGHIPWRDGSMLRVLTELMSLGGLIVTQRGAEVKDIAFHFAAALGLGLLAVRLWFLPPCTRALRGAIWFHALTLLSLWVGISLLSGMWSGDADLSARQAALYAISICWVIALSGLLELRDLGWLLAGISGVLAAAGGLTAWFYAERNPLNRPGFPLGNPATLAASLLPAILMSLAWSGAAFSRWRRTGGRPPWLMALAVLAVLLPAANAFRLADSRGALLALAVGVFSLAFFYLTRRRVWVVAAGVGIVAAGAAYFYSTRESDVMARGATIRLRLYAWRYASDIWQLRPVAGAGAASFTRFATQYSGPDRFLDPAAFQGDWTDHAHNEVFEVLAEIGLLGGLTFVGAWVAVLAAASAMIRREMSPERRWLLSGLAASVAALLADAQFGVNLRLPGGAALLFTLTGALLAACRVMARSARAQSADDDAGRWRWPAAAGASAAAVVVATLAAINTSGLIVEQRAYAALQRGDLASSVNDFLAAQRRLLSPSRVLLAIEAEGRARYLLAAQAFEAAAQQANARGPEAGNPPVAAAAIDAAINRAREAFQTTVRLEQRAPSMPGAAVVRARSAELLAQLYTALRDSRAHEWRDQAVAAWLRHRDQRPSDVETLLSLARYAANLDEFVACLRDALRAGTPPGAWHAALDAVINDPGLDDTLARMLQVAGPITPRTDVDRLVLSRAPEAHRLLAAVQVRRGQFAAAEASAAHAAELYVPMRPRFPVLRSIALLEQAEYRLRSGPQAATGAAALLETGLAELPRIQVLKRAELEQPFERLLALCRLAGGDEAGAAAALRAAGDSADAGALANAYVQLTELYIRQPPATRPALEGYLAAALRLQPAHVRAWSWRAWLAAQSGDAASIEPVLAEAAAAGVSGEALAEIRNGLAAEFPASTQPASSASP